MPGDDSEIQIFPILRGESVGISGEFTGYAQIVKTPDELQFDWTADHIAVLCKGLESFFMGNPSEADKFMKTISAAISEFGEPMSSFSTSAYEQEIICLVKVQDAGHVLENGMHIRISATESQGDVFFID